MRAGPGMLLEHVFGLLKVAPDAIILLSFFIFKFTGHLAAMASCKPLAKKLRQDKQLKNSQLVE